MMTSEATIFGIFQAMASVATVIFVALLWIQLKNQRREHDLTLRPIIVTDNKDGNNPIQYSGPLHDKITIWLTNVGDVAAGRARLIILPADRYGKYRTREKALKEYLKEIGDGKIEKTKSCIKMRSIRERIKRIGEQDAFENYLVLGDDFEELKPALDEFDKILNGMGTKEEVEKFNKAGEMRAESLANLNPADWDKFYLAGGKRGDLLDRTGPIDWEVFDDDIGRDKMREVLGEFADMVYDTEQDRKKILDEMNEEDRDQYDKAIKNRLSIWGTLSPKVGEEFGRTSMNLRTTYKNVKDVKSTMTNMLAPQHRFKLEISLDEANMADIRGGKWVYFGAVIQYSEPGKKSVKHTYHVQGYVDTVGPHLDFAKEYDRIEQWL